MRNAVIRNELNTNYMTGDIQLNGTFAEMKDCYRKRQIITHTVSISVGNIDQQMEARQAIRSVPIVIMFSVSVKGTWLDVLHLRSN
jgi:hypothetical protein